MGFWLVPTSVTLNDTEWHSRYFALFHRYVSKKWHVLHNSYDLLKQAIRLTSSYKHVGRW